MSIEARASELHEQAELLKELAGDDVGKQLRIVAAFAPEFRRIITEYEDTHGAECPNKDKIAWIWSHDHHEDIREVSKSI